MLPFWAISTSAAKFYCYGPFLQMRPIFPLQTITFLQVGLNFTILSYHYNLT